MEIKNQDSAKVEKNTDYKCPMLCEGDKVYDQPGNCPVCNMKLVPVNEKGAQGHQCHCC